EWNREILSQVVLEWIRRENQRGSNRRSAGGVLARGPRRVGKSLMRNIARPLPFHWTPQETSRMLLKMEKDVNACLLGEIFRAEAESTVQGAGRFGCRKF